MLPANNCITFVKLKFGHITMSPGSSEAEKDSSSTPHCCDKVMLSVFEKIGSAFINPRVFDQMYRCDVGVR